MPVEEPPRIPSLRKKFARDGETFRVMNLKGVADERKIGDVGNEIFADAFDGPTAGVDELARFHVFVKDRAGRIGQDHFHAGRDARKETAETGDRSARADTDDDGIDIVAAFVPRSPGRWCVRAPAGWRDCRID